MPLRAALGVAILTAMPAAADVTAARYTEPTTRYDHGVLGDAVEWGALEMTVAACAGCAAQTVTVRLPETRVFEDIAPRLVDLDGDGAREVMVVETDSATGARLAVLRGDGTLMAATPFIGQTRRWLAPLGAADLDGDGTMDVAYVDRPHLAQVLRVWRYQDGALVAVAQAEGHTNHRIGDSTIAGGLRDCRDGVEMVTLTPDWARIQVSRLDGPAIVTLQAGPNDGPGALDRAMRCAR